MHYCHREQFCDPVQGVWNAPIWTTATVHSETTSSDFDDDMDCFINTSPDNDVNCFMNPASPDNAPQQYTIQLNVSLWSSTLFYMFTYLWKNYFILNLLLYSLNFVVW